MSVRFLIMLLAVSAPAVAAQGTRSLYNQDELAELLYANRMALDSIPEVSYRYYVLEDRKINPGENPRGNSVDARAYLYRDAGDGDTNTGREKLNGMVAFLNGVFIQDLAVGDTIVLPSEIDLDPRAYSPFPRHYDGGRGFEKLFIIDKSVQAWAGYENGDLARWGLVSTGADGSETPTGRFNFNWKERYRESTLAPPGETWVMRWVFNFLDERGIHVHQYYALPTTGAASHGCVRLMTADAKWIYDWADGWVTSNGGAERGLASRGIIRQQGTMVLVIGDQPEGAPQRFEHTAEGPRLVRVELPEDPYSVPPGTEQQERFDRKRQLEAAESPIESEVSSR